MIPQRNLSLLSNRLARSGGRRIPEAVLERDYCIAWFLAGLSGARIKSHLACKGGTAIKRCYFGEYRFSEDLDFTLNSEMDFEAIRSGLDEIFDAVRLSSGMVFRYSREDRHFHQNSHTFYIAYEGPLPAVAARMEIKVDITIRERIVFTVPERRVLRGYEEYATGSCPMGRLRKRRRSLGLRQVRRARPQYVADPVSLGLGNGMDLHDRIPFDAIDRLRSYIPQIRQRELIVERPHFNEIRTAKRRCHAILSVEHERYGRIPQSDRHLNGLKKQPRRIDRETEAPSGFRVVKG